MAQLSDLDQYQTVNIGAQADDGSGDNLRDAFIKVNANFLLTKTVLTSLIESNSGTLSSLSAMGFLENLSESERVSPEVVRALRNLKLKELDNLVLNPLRYETFSSEYRGQLALYRQALLDVPQQEGFPTVVVWPVMPTPI